MLIIAINTKKDDLYTNPGHHSIHLGESQVIFKDISSLWLMGRSSKDLPKMYRKVLASHFFGKITKGLIVFEIKTRSEGHF